MKDRSGLFESDLTRDPRAEHIFVVSTVVGALFVLLLWAAVAVVTEPSSRDRAEVTALPTSTTAPAGDRTCRDLVATQADAVRAAERSLVQWRTHVEAMNQLVAGEITLAQASAFWDRTRVGAHRRLEAYQARSAALPDPGTACAASGAATRQGSCVEAAEARARQLRRADTALATWAVHVRHMEMLRRGHLDAGAAARMWQNSWRAGVRQIERYDRAAPAARRQAC